MIITFANIKGGTGKSSVSSATARTLAVSGKKVLLIDLDLQANSTKTLLSRKLKSEDKKIDVNDSVFRTLVNNQDLIPFETNHPNLFIAPATLDLWEADFLIYEQLETANNPRHFRLKRALDIIQDQFDYILIDVSNYPGIITLNAFCASDKVIAITTPGAYETLGVQSLFKIVDKIKENYNSKLEIQGILLNKVEAHLKSHQDSITNLKQDERAEGLLFDVMIRKNSDMQKAQENDQTVMEYNRFSNSGKDIASFVNEAFLR